VPTSVLAMLGWVTLMSGVILLFGDEPIAGLVLLLLSPVFWLLW
jgi:hypothetical protein